MSAVVVAAVVLVTAAAAATGAASTVAEIYIGDATARSRRSTKNCMIDHRTTAGAATRRQSSCGN